MMGTTIMRMDGHDNREEAIERLEQARDHKRDSIIQILLDAGASEEVVNADG